MITQDRIDLNERFIKVFRLLEDRNVIKTNDRDGKGIGDFAHKLLGRRSYGHIVRSFLNPEDKRMIDYHHAAILCDEFGVNKKYMMEGIGSPFGIDLPVPQIASSPNKRNNILFTSLQAFAGASVAHDSFEFEETDSFEIPGLNGPGLVAFPIKGNSMDPVIKDGDIVVCKEVERLTDIHEREIYAVKSTGSVWIKYVQPIRDEKNKIARLKLISANHLEHDPFEEEVGEYTRIYKVVRRISAV